MVLFLFALMFINMNKEAEPHKSNLLKIAATVCSGILLLLIVAATKDVSPETSGSVAAYNPDMGSVKNLGKILYTTYLLPFELTSILLLAAMVGAVMLGKREIKYDFLLSNSLSTVAFKELQPVKPNLFFVPKNNEGLKKYMEGFGTKEGENGESVAKTEKPMQTAFDIAPDLMNRLLAKQRDLPSDLSINKDYLKDLGKKSAEKKRNNKS